MSEIEFKKGPIELCEIQAHINDLRDVRTPGFFPQLMFHGESLFITDILEPFEGKRRIVTLDSKGRRKLFDIDQPLFFDGKVFNFQDEYVEMGWLEYYRYWTALHNSRPDVLRWNGDRYTVYSFTQIVGEEGMYVVIGSTPTERITLKFDSSTVIIRSSNAKRSGASWAVEKAQLVIEGRKWD